MRNILLNIMIAVAFVDCNQSQKSGSTLSLEKKDTVPKELNVQVFREKFDRGVDFVASGNEPFWGLEIDFEKAMHFTTPGGFEMIAPTGEGEKAMDANVVRYSSHTEKGILTVQIAKQECTNDMSGEKSPYTVSIDTKYNTDKDYTRYKGCGRYLSDYRVHDIWVLDSINNEKVKAADFTKGVPQLEFNLTDNKIMGHSGCNNLNGSIEVKGRKIYIGMLATTRMACRNMDFEMAYLKALTNKIIPYEIEPGKLFLSVSADSIFVFKKVD